MFDLNWYYLLLKIVSTVTTPVSLTIIDTHRFRSESQLPKKNTNFNKDYEENTILLSAYIQVYLQYFNMEFKDQFGTKLANKHYGNWY